MEAMQVVTTAHPGLDTGKEIPLYIQHQCASSEHPEKAVCGQHVLSRSVLSDSLQPHGL